MHLFFTALQVAGTLAQSGSSKMCILCSVILITLFVALESRILFLFFFFLNAEGPIHLWGQSVLCDGGLPLREGQSSDDMLTQTSSCNSTICAAVFLFLCWVSKCHDCRSCNVVIQWSCVPQSPLAGYNLSFFSDECSVPLSRLLNLGLLTNECLLLCESRFWNLLSIPPGTTFSLLCAFNVYGTVAESLMWHKLNKVFFHNFGFKNVFVGSIRTFSN